MNTSFVILVIYYDHSGVSGAFGPYESAELAEETIEKLKVCALALGAPGMHYEVKPMMEF